MAIEYTPPGDIFNDQSGRDGVDCDLLLEGTNARGAPLLLVIETKLVEPGLSVCGFTKPGRTNTWAVRETRCPWRAGGSATTPRRLGMSIPAFTLFRSADR